MISDATFVDFTSAVSQVRFYHVSTWLYANALPVQTPNQDCGASPATRDFVCGAVMSGRQINKRNAGSQSPVQVCGIGIFQGIVCANINVESISLPGKVVHHDVLIL